MLKALTVTSTPEPFRPPRKRQEHPGMILMDQMGRNAWGGTTALEPAPSGTCQEDPCFRSG